MKIRLRADEPFVKYMSQYILSNDKDDSDPPLDQLH